jgi:hypothetical protein
MEFERQFAIIVMSVCFTWAITMGYYNLKLESIRGLLHTTLKMFADHGIDLYAWTQFERDKFEAVAVQLDAIASKGWLPKIGATVTCTFGRPQPESSAIPAGIALKAGSKFCYTHRQVARGDALQCRGAQR